MKAEVRYKYQGDKSWTAWEDLYKVNRENPLYSILTYCKKVTYHYADGEKHQYRQKGVY